MRPRDASPRGRIAASSGKRPCILLWGRGELSRFVLPQMGHLDAAKQNQALLLRVQRAWRAGTLQAQVVRLAHRGDINLADLASC